MPTRYRTKELASATDIGEEHIAVTWATLDEGTGGYRALVEIVAPDFHPEERIDRMLRSVAASVGRAVGGEVFVELRHARSGLVHDGGEVVRW